MRIALIERKRQDHWKWPVVVNYFLGGSGAGLYLVSIFFRLIIYEDLKYIDFRWIDAISVLLMVAGVSSMSFEAGRPWMASMAIANIRSAWISRELALVCSIIILSGLSIILDSPYILALLAVLSALFILSQYMILYKSVAVSQWRKIVISISFLSSGMTSGWALYLLFYVVKEVNIDKTIMIPGIVIIIIDALTWMIYYRGYAAKKGISLFERMKNAIIIFGRLIPLVILLYFAWLPQYEMDYLIMTILGIWLPIVNLMQKQYIVRDAGYFDPISIEMRMDE